MIKFSCSEGKMITRYYKKTNENLCKKLNLSKLEECSYLVLFKEEEPLAYLSFNIKEEIWLNNLYYHNQQELSYLFSKLFFVNYLNKKIMLNKCDYFKNEDFYTKHFTVNLVKDVYLLSYKISKANRYFDIGNFMPGKLNNIADVPGVKVGHYSLQDNEFQTGITAIIPHRNNLFKEKVLASSYVYNGFGKSSGLLQIEELGNIETPILLTNTLNVGKVSDGLIEYMLEGNEDIGITTGTINPIVLECNDGELNNIRIRSLSKNEVYLAIEDAKEDFLQGSIGAGSGMTCHGFKGGIGSSSRVVNVEEKEYYLGVLVNSNFQGSSAKDLIINNNYLGDKFSQGNNKDDQGSIIIVVATDIPLSERQLKRVLKRCIIGLARTGSYVNNGSGDIVVGFSTATKTQHYPEAKLDNIKSLNNNFINDVFKACIEATEEAIINSLVYSKTTTGVRGKTVYSINEELDVFSHLLQENILGG